MEHTNVKFMTSSDERDFEECRKSEVVISFHSDKFLRYMSQEKVTSDFQNEILSEYLNLLTLFPNSVVVRCPFSKEECGFEKTAASLRDMEDILFKGLETQMGKKICFLEYEFASNEIKNIGKLSKLGSKNLFSLFSKIYFGNPNFYGEENSVPKKTNLKRNRKTCYEVDPGEEEGTCVHKHGRWSAM